jgi:hypothetical protein
MYDLPNPGEKDREAAYFIHHFKTSPLK